MFYKNDVVPTQSSTDNQQAALQNASSPNDHKVQAPSDNSNEEQSELEHFQIVIGDDYGDPFLTSTLEALPLTFCLGIKYPLWVLFPKKTLIFKNKF